MGESLGSTNVIIQGCPLSVMLLNALMMVLHHVIQPHVMAESFVDDLTMLHQEVPEHQAALDLIDEFIKATDQEVNACKTKGFGLKSEQSDLKFKGCAPSKHIRSKNSWYDLEVHGRVTQSFAWMIARYKVFANLLTGYVARA